MRKNIIYILMIVLIMSVFTGCKNKETEDKEIMEGNNAVTSEDTLRGNDSDDSLNIIKDNNNGSNDNIEIENKENKDKENEDKEIENKENKDKEIENRENQSKENVNKENVNKESVKNEKKENTNSIKENNKNENNEDKNRENENNKKEDNKDKNIDKDKDKNKDKDKDKNIDKDKDKDKNKESNKDKDKNDNNDKDDSNDQKATELDLSTIIDKIYDIKNPGLMLGKTTIDLSNSDSVKYNTGLSDASKIKEAVVSEAMMGSQAYSLVLVKLKDSKDAESVAKEMLNGINPRKWICVEADDLQIVSHDDVIMLIMVASSFEEKVTSQQIVDAFKKVCDDELDIKLKK